MSNKREIPLTEQEVLRILYNNLDFLEPEYNDYFISKIGQALFKGLFNIKDKDITPSFRSLLLHGVKHYEGLKVDHLQFLKSENTKTSSVSDLEYYVDELKKHKIIESLQNEKLDDFNIEITKKNLNLEALKSKLESMQNDIDRIENNGEDEKYELLSRYDEALRFKEVIEKRKEGIHYPSGDSYLDKYLYNNSLMPQEMSFVFANSGSGKSTFIRNLVERRILKNLPTLDIQLEMSLESTLDSKMGIRMNQDRSNFNFNKSGHIDEDNEQELLDNRYDDIDRLINIELSKAKRHNNYFQLNLESMTISEFKKIVKIVKKKLGLGEKDYLFVTIDLMSKMRDFNIGKSGKADLYENALNSMQEIVKEEYLHVMGVFQPKRPSDKVSITSIENTYKLKPNTESLKNSGAIEESGRVIISVFRPYFTLKKYNPEAPELDYLEDVVELNILKQNSGDISPTLYYKFNAEKGRLYAYPDFNPDLAYNTDDEEEEDEEKY